MSVSNTKIFHDLSLVLEERENTTLVGTIRQRRTNIKTNLESFLLYLGIHNALHLAGGYRLSVLQVVISITGVRSRCVSSKHPIHECAIF